MNKKLTQAIIGAGGNMGKFLVQTLASLGPIVEVERNSSLVVWKKALRADVAWFSVPRDEVDKILHGKKLKRSQLVVDICTVKRGVGKVIESSGAAHLSLHPLHGPKVPMIGQRWAVIETPSHGERHPKGRAILEFLKKQGVAFLPPVSERHHDFMMGVVLSIPEVFTIVFEQILAQYAKHAGKKVPAGDELMRWAVPASNALFSACVHIINSTPEWLRYEIVKETPHDTLNAVRDACRDIEKLSLANIKEKIAQQAKRVSRIPPAERDHIRRWINQWFVDSTKAFFKAAKKTRVKPTLTIQWMEPKETIFPRAKMVMTVGIHGVAGCFTHEALLRFLEENGIPERRVAPKFLVTAENVLNAVMSGATDLGIFAIANSGSGAYVSSMKSIAEHAFKVKAVLGMEIMQCLLAHKSVENVEEIKEVFGHPQAVSQCKRTLEESYPRLKVTAGKDSDDTALCAKRIAKGDLPRTTATLASQVAARRHGLNIISYNMHHDPFNTTTFLLVAKR